MSMRSWFRNLFTRPADRTVRKTPRRLRLSVEALENRLTPTITFLSGPLGPTSDNTPTFEFATDNPAVTTQCHIDGAPFVSSTSPFTSAPLADGPHTFVVHTIDAAGNVVESASRSFIVDTMPPMVTILSGPSSVTNDNTPTFAFITELTAVITECRIDVGAYVPTPPVPASFTSATLADGPHTFEVRAVDPAGNVAFAYRQFTVDTAPVTLTSLEVTPANPSVAAGLTQQFIAVGTFSDGTTLNLTNSVTWSSSHPAVATISNAAGTKGLATGQAAGFCQIVASMGSVLGSTTLAVNAKVTLTGNVSTQDSLNLAKQGKLTITIGNVLRLANGDTLADVVSTAHYFLTVTDESGTRSYEFIPTTVTTKGSSITITYTLKDSALASALAAELAGKKSAATAIDVGFRMESTNYTLSDDNLTRLFSSVK